MVGDMINYVLPFSFVLNSAYKEAWRDQICIWGFEMKCLFPYALRFAIRNVYEKNLRFALNNSSKIDIKLNKLIGYDRKLH